MIKLFIPNINIRYHQFLDFSFLWYKYSSLPVWLCSILCGNAASFRSFQSDKSILYFIHFLKNSVLLWFALKQLLHVFPEVASLQWWKRRCQDSDLWETLRLKELLYFIWRERSISEQYNTPTRMSHYMMCGVIQRQSTKMEKKYNGM